jgi:hypothetical protein
MTHRSRIFAAAVLGLSLASAPAARAAEPSGSAPLPSLPSAVAEGAKAPAPPGLALDRIPTAPAEAPPGSRQVADAIGDALRQAGKAGQLRHYNIDVTVKDGTAELTGTVASQQQREEVLKLVNGVTGVRQVVDKLALLAPNPIAQIQATAPPAPGLQSPPAAPPPGELAPPPQLREPLPPAGAGAPPNGIIPEPVPTFAAPMPSPYDLNPPRMPPYAWPTYAPFNNFSRVAYPDAYPYQSWPFIGPCYPFPKIPPGWRSVKLEWQDGYWWFSKIATRYDWWRMRFW